MFKQRIFKFLIILQEYLNEEKDSTKEMLKAYYNYLNKNVTEDELRTANLHLKKILQELNMGLLASLPFSPISIPLIAFLAKKLNVDIVPDWFKESSFKK